MAVIAFAPGAFWQNDLSKLTPVPADALARDAELRDELGAPDVRYVLTLQRHGRRSRCCRPRNACVRRWTSWSHEKALAGYDMAARYLPSAAVQRARQAQLPDRRSACAPRSTRRSPQTPFRADAFEPIPRRRRTRRSARRR